MPDDWPRASCCGEPRVAENVDRCYDHAKLCRACNRNPSEDGICPSCIEESSPRAVPLGAEAVAVCWKCQRRFDDFEAARSHYHLTAHDRWTIPSSWLRDRGWTIERLFGGR